MFSSESSFKFSGGDGKKREVVLSACLKSATGDSVRVDWPKSAMSKKEAETQSSFSAWAITYSAGAFVFESPRRAAVSDSLKESEFE